MNADLENSPGASAQAPKDAQDDFSEAAASVTSTGDGERRLHLQAFDYWHELKGNRAFPLFAELRAEDLAPFKSNSLLLEFNQNGTVVRFLGDHLSTLIEGDIQVGSYLGDFPDEPFARALLGQFAEESTRSRAVEFEFLETWLNCRGIMLPFSRDGGGAHFMMVVASFAAAAEGAADIDAQTEEAHPGDATILRGLLGSAQRAADTIVHMDSGNRSSLYDALASAFALYEAGVENKAAYQAMLDDAGLKAQVRAPYTPALKLVFGAGYDKTRLTEYAAALSYAARNGKTSREISDYLKSMPGGIKGCVQEERAFKRSQEGTPAHNRQKEAEDYLRHAPDVPLKDINPDDEFCLILARRKSGGGVEVLGHPNTSKAALDAAIRQLASPKILASPEKDPQGGSEE
jgi:hypothetical protein